MFYLKNGIVVFLSLLCVVQALYEDQIGKFDWKQNYVGKIKYAAFDSVKRVVVATEENVIASLHLKNGEIFWRQVLENPINAQIEMLHVDKDAVTVSGGANNWYVRGWDLSTGMLLYEWTLYTEKSVKAHWIVFNNQLLHVLPIEGSHLEITTYQLQTGRNSGTTSRLSTPWVTDLSKCTVSETYLACISSDDSTGQLYYIDLSLQSSTVYTFAIQSLIGNPPGRVQISSFKHSKPAVLLTRNGAARLLLLKPGIPDTLPYALSPYVIAAPNGDQTLLLQFVSNENTMTLNIQSVELEGGIENNIETEFQNNVGAPLIVDALCRGAACRVLFTTGDSGLSLLQLPAGKILWTREEGLSHIVATEFVELPISDLDASIEHEFDSASGDIFGLLYNRISSQLRQLSVVLSGQQRYSDNSLVQDDFGLHKLIVIASKVGKLYALDSLTGVVVWSKYIPDIKPFSILEKSTIVILLQRTARYLPVPAQCVLLAKDRATGNGIIYEFDPITGQSANGVERLPYQIKQAMLLPYEDETHFKGLLILADNEQVHVYPSSAQSILHKHASSVFMYSADSNSGLLRGYSLMHSSKDTPSISRTWELNLGQAQLVEIAVRPITERVHSQGRVLADRSVLYKYINPNLLSVATLANDALHKNVLSIYMVDGVSGLVVYSVSHKRARGPIHLVHSENWLMYTYYSERFRRVELAAVELYEGARQSNSTAFSSHAVSQLPHAETQAYILPATPVAMKATLTERGITNKHILVALTSGSVTELPWAFIEPRGALTPSGPEEGIIPYMPELPLPSEAIINYNQTLPRIRGVQVAPARLESTCLVIVHGLDLFYTRVTPSKTFDLLKEDFDHWLIGVVLVGLIFASYITKRLASRKAIKQAWK